MSNFWSRFFVVFVLVLSVVTVFGQPKFNSPYSRLGLGDLFNPNFAALNGIADLSAAMHDPYHINMQNPASLSYLRATAFEVGLRAKYSSLKSADGQQQEIWNGNLAYLSLGFPLRNQLNEVLDRKNSKLHFGMNFSLVPFTTVGYDIETSEIRENIGQIRYQFEGTGGSYKLQWGNAVRYDNFSFGLNMGYLFGKLSRNQEVRFDSLEASYVDVFVDEVSLNGFIWNVGVQYDVVFKSRKDGKMVPNGKRLIIGAYGNSITGFSTTSSQYYSRQNLFYGDVDTVRNAPLVKQSGKLPAEWHLGAIYQNSSKYRVGFDISQAYWSQYENEAKVEAPLKNTWRVAVGGEFIPDIASYNSYARRMRYRAGFFYGTDSRSDSFNKQLTNYGVTLGLGFPVILPRQQKSFVNLALEIGQFGTEASLQETYGKLTLGFTLNDDTWFFKRKFY